MAETQKVHGAVKRRLKALKKLQMEMIKVEFQLHKGYHELESKYAAQYEPLFEKRRAIINARLEPTDSDCEWASSEEEDSDEDEEEEEEEEDEAEAQANADGDNEDEEEDDEKLVEESSNMLKKASKPKKNAEDGDCDASDSEESEEEDNEEEGESPNGVPDFWLTIFKNVKRLSDMVLEPDEEVLASLTDIKVKYMTSEPMGFCLCFHFKPNDFFTNSILTKQYIMRSEPDEQSPNCFKGPEIIDCKGCTIDWKKGKNITQIDDKELVQDSKDSAMLADCMRSRSFFSFFNPPKSPEGVEADPETVAVLAADFGIGYYIQAIIIPRAVLYYTGDALQYDDSEDEEDEEIDDFDSSPPLSQRCPNKQGFCSQQ